MSFAWFNERRSPTTIWSTTMSISRSPSISSRVPAADSAARSIGTEPIRARVHPAAGQLGAVYNLSPPPPGIPDPPFAWNLYPNDGGPTRLLNDSVTLVPVAPLPVTEFLVEDFKDPRAEWGDGGAVHATVRAACVRNVQPRNPFGLTDGAPGGSPRSVPSTKVARDWRAADPGRRAEASRQESDLRGRHAPVEQRARSERRADVQGTLGVSVARCSTTSSSSTRPA